MALTTAIIDKYKKRINDDYAQNQVAISRSRSEAQRRKQLEMVALSHTSTLCSPSEQLRLKPGLLKANDEKLKEELGQQFTNIDVARVAACSVDSVFTVLPSQSLTLQEAVNEYITNPRQIGSESAYGYALLGGLGDASDFLIAKTPRQGLGSDLEHELFVALNGTNKMRQLGIPNYALVYGGYRCSKATINPQTKKVVQWCSNNVNGSVPYTVYENISPGETVDKFLKTADSQGVAAMFVQVVFAVIAGYTMIGFTHYDAHTGNVIRRFVPDKDKFQIKYDLKEAGTYYVKTDAVSTFIDFGMSVIKYNGETVGLPEPELEKIIMYTDRPHPLHDVYKFLMFCLRDLLPRKDREGAKAFSELAVLLKYFNSKESASQVIKNQWKTRYSIPIMKDQSIVRFAEFMGRHYVPLRGVLSTKPFNDVPPLDCQTCWTASRLLRYVESNLDNVNLVQYYDLYAKSTSGPDFDYPKARRQHLDKTNTLLSKGDSINVGTTEYNTDFLITQAGIDYSVANHFAIFELLGIIDRLEIYNKVTAWCITAFSDNLLERMMVPLADRTRLLRYKLCKSINSQVNNVSKGRRDNNWYATTQANDISLIKIESVCTGNIYSKEDDEVDDIGHWHILGVDDTLYPVSRRLTINERGAVTLNK